MGLAAAQATRRPAVPDTTADHAIVVPRTIASPPAPGAAPAAARAASTPRARAWWQSKKFVTTLASCLVIVADALTGARLPREALAALVLTVVSYLLAEAGVDVARAGQGGGA